MTKAREALEQFREVAPIIMELLLDINGRESILLCGRIHDIDRNARIALAEMDDD